MVDAEMLQQDQEALENPAVIKQMLMDDEAASAKAKADKKAANKPVSDAAILCMSNLIAEINALLPPIIEQAEEAKAAKDADSKAAAAEKKAAGDKKVADAKAKVGAFIQ